MHYLLAHFWHHCLNIVYIVYNECPLVIFIDRCFRIKQPWLLWAYRFFGHITRYLPGIDCLRSKQFFEFFWRILNSPTDFSAENKWNKEFQSNRINSGKEEELKRNNTTVFTFNVNETLVGANKSMENK